MPAGFRETGQHGLVLFSWLALGALAGASRHGPWVAGLGLPRVPAGGRAAWAPGHQPAAPRPLGAAGTHPGTCPPGTASAGCLRGPWASHAFLCHRLARSKLGIICQAVPLFSTNSIGLNHSNKLNKGNIFSAPAGEAVALQAGLAHQRTSIRGSSSF